MSRRLLAAALIAGIAMGFWLPGGLSLHADQIGSLAAFAVAASLLGLYDVWLPRGDSADMGGALACSAGLVLGPLPGAIVVVVSGLVAAFAGRRARSFWIVIEAIVGRVFSVVWSAIAFSALGGWLLAKGAPEGPVYFRVMLAAALFSGVESLLVQIGASLRLSSPLFALIAGNIRLLGWMSVAEVSVAALSALIWGAMGPWGLTIVSALLLVMRQSFALLVDVKQAYRSTIEVLARALEAHDPERRGHAERVAALTTEAGRALGIGGQRLEDLGYAALFHDVGQLGDEGASLGASGAADVLKDVTLMSGAMPILTVLDSRGTVSESLPEETLVAAYIIARASEFDDETHDRPGEAASGAVGTRLYTSTRQSVDRALRRIESRVTSGHMSPAGGVTQEVS